MNPKSFLVLFTILLLMYQQGYAKQPHNISLAKQAVKTYYLSGEYNKDVEKVVHPAEIYLMKRIKENNSLTHEKLAIVLDIDDTSLSNFRSHIKRDFSNTDEANHLDYVEASATAIEPVLRVVNLAIRNGVSVFFISFRPESARQYTITNLQKAGYFGWKKIILPNNNEIKMHPATFKTQIRKKLTDDGYTIILNFGDQDSDIAGGYAEQVVKIPNPMYLNMQAQ